MPTKQLKGKPGPLRRLTLKKVTPTQLAYLKIDLDAETKVKELPKITHILKSLPKGIDSAIEYLRGSVAHEAKLVLTRWDSMSRSQKKLIPFEAYCVGINGGTRRILEIITSACFDQSSSAATLLAAASHPDIVKATVKAAKSPRFGTADRKMLHMHRGFVPVSKNQTTIISSGGQQNNVGQIDNSKQLTISMGEVTAVDSKMLKVANRFNERMGIESGAPPPVIEATEFKTMEEDDEKDNTQDDPGPEESDSDGW